MTKRGQLALAVRECTMLGKALRDPPDLFHGIADPEVRYRQRELDLMANERSREIFAMRAKLVAAIRNYLNERDFVEVETPILQTLAGGAAARPFTTHHHALNRELFLRTATELYLKRAIVGGFENVYELSRFFRNEGISPKHNPEFTMLEWFLSCAGYEGVMAFAEQMISTVVEQVLGTTVVERDGRTIDFKAPWKRITLRDAILEETGVDILTASRDELVELLGEDVDPDADWAWIVDEIQGKLIEPKLVQPTFLVDLPRELWPTVKPVPEHPELLGEAFDGVVDGMEIIGGGTDTNDADMQRENFVRQRQRRHPESEEAPYPSDDEFVRALEYGSLPAGGSGIGIDRLTMILAGAENLRDVILFPSMRRGRCRRALTRGAHRRLRAVRKSARRPPLPGSASEGRAQQAAVDRDDGAGDVGGALGAEEGDQVAVLLGPAEAGGGDFAAAPPLRRPRASRRASASRSVAKRPVATVLTVIPSAATSRESVLRKPTAAIRWELERLRPGIGSRVELEPTLTIRPQPRSRIPGTTAPASTRGARTSER